MPYIGGFPIYVSKCNEVMEKGLEGFILEGTSQENSIPQARWTKRWRAPLDMDVISPATIAARRVPIV
jgi:cyclohexanone monooxygenase